MQIKTLTLYFDKEISNFEIPLFRGSIIATMGGNAQQTFHNHEGEKGYRYSYPLIQYKRINGKAAIVCVGEGVEHIGQFISNLTTEYAIGRRTVIMTIDKILPNETLIQACESNYQYTLSRWLPLNTENYKAYTNCMGIIEKIQLLERILRGNILSMAKGLGIFFEQEVSVFISDIEDTYIVENKHTKLMAFDIQFVSNVSLPDYIGLGKNASIGYGIVKSITDK